MVMQNFAKRKQGAYMVYVKMVNCQDRSPFLQIQISCVLGETIRSCISLRASS